MVKNIDKIGKILPVLQVIENQQLATPLGFDRKFRGEILKIERRNLEDFPPKFAVKLLGLFKPLIINTL